MANQWTVRSPQKPDQMTQAQHAGANMERAAWMAKVRREAKRNETFQGKRALEEIEAWGKERVKRFRKVQGGL